MNLKSVLTRKFMLDKYQLTFLLTRVWNLVGYLVTFLVVANYLGKVEQGYYYTLNSLIALQVFFELGFSYVIVQKTSHLYSAWNADSLQPEAKVAFAHISSFFYYILQWFLGCAVLFIGVLLVVGRIFFSADISAHIPSLNILWLLLVILTAFNLVLTALLSFFEGFGKAIIVYRIKLYQNVFSQFVLWVAIFCGMGLRSILFSNSMMLLIGSIFVFIHFRKNIRDLFRQRTNRFIFWFKELFKYQSKVALSWISGYFQFQLLSPIVFHYIGPIEAGRMGNTFTIVSGITALSLALIQSKSWEYSSLIALNNFKALGVLFKKHLTQIITLGVVIGTCVYLGVLFINYFGYTIAQKILPPLPFLFFVIATILNVVIACIAIYLRAFLEEKLLWVSMLTGLSIISFLLIVTPHYGLIGVSLVYLSCTFLIGFIGSVFVYRRKINSLPA